MAGRKRPEGPGVWEKFTRDKCLIYHGYGAHMSMLNTGFIDKNAAIVTRILKKEGRD
jgi:hypothetical protein